MNRTPRPDLDLLSEAEQSLLAEALQHLNRDDAKALRERLLNSVGIYVRAAAARAA